ncbi:carboxypeptidase-like regulatory domain-containing protein [Myroides sp. 1354]|uniref:carboxypeptidase-like regulatory domain-containing protein n=1 Tax=unclassified Myroides TaxID=2642485 RepID=UPI0025780C11|nr:MULTISPECIES: carboxypeptidase-like regulatory domain-containing protein [unclassified Myroides]MDM1043293.1 carboxypeptidase-like regulatory domain-containing protein [Myroides sp. R163-1]MDM1054654.1 carboxypeptidase-like regulatory domain-containing protein [Myroides sp. 1354]MDM1067951.1 carboxypeptidase-like regulatory domain-containing protein [Myroides sp. 1372]
MAKYIIQIPKPCSEDWNQMTPLEKGRFCVSCEKEIYDFSTYTKQEFINRIKKGDKLCGRIPVKFLNTELNDDLYETKGFRFNGLVATFVNLLILTAATTVQAQEKRTTEQLSFRMDQSKNENESILSQERVLKGVVVDEEKNALPGAVVAIFDTEYKVETDVFGKFEFVIPEDSGKQLDLSVSFIGLDTQIITVTDFETVLEIVMVEEVIVILMGEPTISRKKK